MIVSNEYTVTLHLGKRIARNKSERKELTHGRGWLKAERSR